MCFGPKVKKITGSFLSEYKIISQLNFVILFFRKSGWNFDGSHHWRESGVCCYDITANCSDEGVSYKKKVTNPLRKGQLKIYKSEIYLFFGLIKRICMDYIWVYPCESIYIYTWFTCNPWKKITFNVPRHTKILFYLMGR